VEIVVIVWLTWVYSWVFLFVFSYLMVVVGVIVVLYFVGDWF
jgi:hypothetical protein